MWLRLSSSGSFSNAERLISSIKRRCRRTLASRSLSVSDELAAGGGGGSGAGSGKPVKETVSAKPASTAGTRAGAATWCVEKRPAISMSYHGYAAPAAVARLQDRAHDSFSFL